MSERSRRLDEYLDHILNAIGKIERYTTDMSKATFLVDELVQDGVIRNFEIIGDSSRNILQRFPNALPNDLNQSLSAAYGMRNVLSHSYDEVDLDIVWTAIVRDLPALRERIFALRG
jgi:uncharacterized protein with HEPN domain